MKIKVCKSWRENNYFILIEKNYHEATSSEVYIAEFLGLSLQEYFNLIMQNGGFLVQNYYHYFNTQEECQNFIEKIIEPRLVMKKLIE